MAPDAKDICGAVVDSGYRPVRWRLCTLPPGHAGMHTDEREPVYQWQHLRPTSTTMAGMAAVRVEKARAAGLKTQPDYERVASELAELRLQKMIEYGEDRFTEDDIDFAMLMCYSDVYRKFIRLRTLTKNARLDLDSAEGLRDAYMDLANYAIQAVMEIDRFDLLETKETP